MRRKLTEKTSQLADRAYAAKRKMDNAIRVEAHEQILSEMLWVFDEQAYKTHKAGATDLDEDVARVPVVEPCVSWMMMMMMMMMLMMMMMMVRVMMMMR